MECMGDSLSPKKSGISLNYFVRTWDVVSSAGLVVAWAVDYHLHRKVVAGI